MALPGRFVDQFASAYYQAAACQQGLGFAFGVVAIGFLAGLYVLVVQLFGAVTGFAVGTQTGQVQFVAQGLGTLNQVVLLVANLFQFTHDRSSLLLRMSATREVAPRWTV